MAEAPVNEQCEVRSIAVRILSRGPVPVRTMTWLCGLCLPLLARQSIQAVRAKRAPCWDIGVFK